MSIVRKSVKESSIKEVTAKSGTKFHSVSFKYNDSDSGWASFAVFNDKYIMPGDEDGTKNVVVSEDDNGIVQINYKKGDKYVNKRVPASEIGETSDLVVNHPVRLYRLPKKWVHARKSKKNGKEFYSVSFPVTESETGWGSILIWNKEDIAVHRNRDGNADERYLDVKIADNPNQKLRISIAKDGGYSDIEKTAKQIADDRKKSNDEYFAKLNAQNNIGQAAETEKAETAESFDAVDDISPDDLPF